MNRLALGLIAATFIALVLSANLAFAQEKPAFKLGFKAMADQIPNVVGEPVENEHYGPNGDSLQQTTTGLMVWRKSDNWTAFTDGSQAWIIGPYGIQQRLNTERFPWERDLASTAGTSFFKGIHTVAPVERNPALIRDLARMKNDGVDTLGVTVAIGVWTANLAGPRMT